MMKKSVAGKLLEEYKRLNEGLVSFNTVPNVTLYKAFHNSGIMINFDDNPEYARAYRIAVKQLGYDLMLSEDSSKIVVTDKSGNPVDDSTASKVIADAAESDVFMSLDAPGGSDFPWDDKEKMEIDYKYL